MNKTSQHISSQFDEELEDIKNQVLSMGGQVEQQFSRALEALASNDPKIIESIIQHETKINELEVNIDKKCTDILAMRQPKAIDLRLIMTTSKILVDLERIADESEKIANNVTELYKKKCPKSYYVSISTMGSLVNHMLHEALDAFARLDEKESLRVANKEPKSDDLYGAILRQLITHMIEDTKVISIAIHIIMVSRSIERIGDHTRNICEHIIYLVKGIDVRHQSLEQIKKQL